MPLINQTSLLTITKDAFINGEKLLYTDNPEHETEALILNAYRYNKIKQVLTTQTGLFELEAHLTALLIKFNMEVGDRKKSNADMMPICNVMITDIQKEFLHFSFRDMENIFYMGARNQFDMKVNVWNNESNISNGIIYQWLKEYHYIRLDNLQKQLAWEQSKKPKPMQESETAIKERSFDSFINGINNQYQMYCKTGHYLFPNLGITIANVKDKTYIFLRDIGLLEPYLTKEARNKAFTLAKRDLERRYSLQKQSKDKDERHEAIAKHIPLTQLPEKYHEIKLKYPDAKYDAIAYLVDEITANMRNMILNKFINACKDNKADLLKLMQEAMAKSGYKHFEDEVKEEV